MDNKNLLFIFFVLCVLFLFSCGKKKNLKLAQTYNKMALLELTEGRFSEQSYKKALSYINKAIECDPRTDYLAFKATLLFKVNRAEEGDIFFQKALRKKMPPETRAEIMNNQACLLAQIGMSSGREEKITKAMNIWRQLEKDKNYLTPEVSLVNQSKVFFERENYKEAKKSLLKAVEVAPGFLDAHYYLSIVAYKLREYQLVKKEIQTVLFINPNHVGAKELNNIIEKM